MNPNEILEAAKHMFEPNEWHKIRVESLGNGIYKVNGTEGAIVNGKFQPLTSGRIQELVAPNPSQAHSK